MSWQASAWALKQTIVTSPTARHVLLCMANYAGPNGEDVFPGVATLEADTGLSRRAVQIGIKTLLELGAIKLGNQAMVAIKIPRADQRPINYDLCISEERGALNARRDETGRSSEQSGAHVIPERGAGGAPKPSLELSIENSMSESDDSKALARYQEVAKTTGQSMVLKLTDKRRAALKARLKEYGLESWRAALDRMEHSDFLTGKSGTWKADFDFLLRPDSVAKILEGKYDNRGFVAPSAPIPENEIWPRRMKFWIDNDLWNPEWGNPPDAPGCVAPRDLIKKALAERERTQK